MQKSIEIKWKQLKYNEVPVETNGKPMGVNENKWNPVKANAGSMEINRNPIELNWN